MVKPIVSVRSAATLSATEIALMRLGECMYVCLDTRTMAIYIHITRYYIHTIACIHTSSLYICSPSGTIYTLLFAYAHHGYLHTHHQVLYTYHFWHTHIIAIYILTIRCYMYTIACIHTIPMYIYTHLVLSTYHCFHTHTHTHTHYLYNACMQADKI